MLINPYHPESKDLLATIPGTHLIIETLGVVGVSFNDPMQPGREWTICGLYSPVRGRALGGIRAKLFDQKSFVTFCNQRDLEVLLELAIPGSYCHWLDRDYVGPDDAGWFGLCVDEQDLLDDLYDRELEARALYQEGDALPPGLGFQRRVHAGTRNDFIEHMELLWDADPESGISPDTRLETVMRRWTSLERTVAREREKLWLRL